MQELFRKKSSDFNMIQDGMKTIKAFQKMKAQMEQELSDVSEGVGCGGAGGSVKSACSFCQDVNATGSNDLIIL